MTYDDVMGVLQSAYRWNLEPSAAPDPDGVNRALAEDRTVDEIAALLTKQASRTQGPPEGHSAYGNEDLTWAYKLRHTFGSSSHFVGMNTEIALGYQPAEIPPKIKAGAKTADDLIELTAMGWHWNGQSQFLDISKPAGKAEYDRRMAFAKQTVPRPWTDVDPELYRHLVVVDRLPSKPAVFGVRVNEQYKDVYGLTLQKWLDNQWCNAQQKPWIWKSNGERSEN